MAEHTILVDKKTVSYSGLFRLNELYSITRKFLMNRGYFIVETKNQEDVMEDGKTVWVRLEPWRRYNDYAQGDLRIDIIVRRMKDKTVKMHGHEQKYQQGEVQLVFWAWLKSDRRSQWEGSGFQFLFRTLSNKFIRRDFLHNMMDMTTKDCIDLQDAMKDYLNMSRMKLAPQPKVEPNELGP